MSLTKHPLIITHHVRLVRRASQKTIRLRLDAKAHQIVCSFGANVPDAYVLQFLEAHAPWMQQQIAKFTDAVPLHKRPTLCFLGQDYEAHYHSAKRIHFWEDEGAIHIYAPPARYPVALERYVRLRAARFFQEACEAYATRLGVTVTRVRIYDPKSQWGNCSTKGVLSFSWRLLLAPRPIADYVAAHEVAHLIHFDHSAAFWGVVHKIDPSASTHRRWLKEKGSTLSLLRI